MFDTPADARLVLERHLPRRHVDLALGALVPAIALVPVRGARVIGASRIGGTPDLPPGLDWPRRPRPPDGEAIAGRASPEAGKALAEHFRLELPYAFLAQIDLGEAAGLGPVAQALPDEGRLLVFYDLVGGPYDTGSESVRVVWDRSRRESLAAQALPPALEDAARRQRRETAQALAAQGMKPPGAKGSGSSTPYDSPARPMRLKAVLRLPDGDAGGLGRHPALEALRERDPDGYEAVREGCQAVRELFFDRHFGAGNPGRRHQLLGSANPEQDDPRLDAVVATRFGLQHLDRDTWKTARPEIEAESRQWRLLLQVDLSDHAQDDLVEGTVYVLIREEDLKARRFERAVAVYQQT